MLHPVGGVSFLGLVLCLRVCYVVQGVGCVWGEVREALRGGVVGGFRGGVLGELTLEQTIVATQRGFVLK